MNRRWFIFSLFIFIWLSPSIIHCQTINDSLFDVWPLSIGNQWTYRYFTSIVNWPSGNPGTVTTDSGRVIYSIIESSTNTDSTIWHFHVQRDLKHHIVYSFMSAPDLDSISFIHDTSSFILIEQHAGQHQLYRNADPYRIRLDVFPFTRNYTDTTMVYRFRIVGIGDTTSFLSWIYHMSGSYFKSTFTFQKGVGLIRNSYNSGTADVSSINEHFLLSSIITSVSQQISHTLPNTFSLSQNYPNPFNPSTTINYFISKKCHVELNVFDALGKEIVCLVNGFQESGDKSVHWNAGNIASGIYFYQIKAGSSSMTKKMFLLK